MIDEDAEIMRAVARYAATVTVPILRDCAPDKVDQVGTATLFDHGGRLLLVTAGHIFDEIKAEDLVIPSRNTRDVHGIGPYHLFRPDNPDIDLAIVELRHPPSIERARASWTVLDVARTSTASDEGWFVLTGYPSVKSRHVGGLLGSTLLCLHSWRLSDTPAGAQQPVYPDLDLFFRFEEQGEVLTGEIDAVPHLGGCSGGAIWEYREPTDMLFWTVEQCLRFVGVQSSFNRSSKYFRAKSWTYLRSCMEKLIEQYPDA